MAVIVDDFEVSVESPPEATAEPTREPQVRPAPPIVPQDLRDVIRHQAERQARLRAH